MRRHLPTTLAATLALVASVVLGAGLLGTGTAEAATAAASASVVPPAPRATTGIEAAAAYVPDVSCDGVLKPGTAKLAMLLTTTYPGTTAGTVRGCGTDGSTSEHYDGRAVDWMTSVRTPEGAARASALVGWLLAPDAGGNAFANARRLGVMYVIWNGKIWGAYRPSDGWRPYSSCASHPEAAWDTACHRDHVHLSLSWEGAMARTSYWTGSVAARDYGPCRTADLTWAPPYTGARSTPCPAVSMPTAPTGASTLTRQLVAASGAVLRAGSGGAAVTAVNQLVGATGTAWTATTTARLKAYQGARRVAATGVMDVPTWRATTGAAVLAAATPVGAMDAATVTSAGVRVSGWAFDGEDDAAITVVVVVDGRPTTAVRADSLRAELPRFFANHGPWHGFVGVVRATPGAHQVCVIAVNAGLGRDVLVGCRTAVVPR